MDTAPQKTDDHSTDELAQLSVLVPLNTLTADVLATLVEADTLATANRGESLFGVGDETRQHVYLLEGTVVLLSNNTIFERIRAGSETARFPLAHQLPRKYTARAETKVRIARIDSQRLSDALASDRAVDYQVSSLEEASEDDWMGMLLQSSVLQQVPASNIQRVMMSVEHVAVEAGEDLVCQGDPGDYYYMLTAGQAVVLRDSGDGRGAQELATLGPGDAFGEDALVSDSPRNSTVKMLQDGTVLRLSKEHFLQFIHNPLLEKLDHAAAQQRVDAGAIWLDLRGAEEHKASHLPGSINIPFEALRAQLPALDKDTHYVLYSNTGGRSTAGAFLLTEHGFEVSVLQNGLRGQAGVAVADAPAMGATQAPDTAMQQQIQQAEQRARELEERLKAAQLDQESLASEREQHLTQVRSAVEKARLKLAESERQKREALAAQQKAYAEMEQLSGNLEALQNERSSLLDRMSEIEGQDKQLQSRLTKSERELIGERDRAESATSTLQELSDKLAEQLEKRAQEREQHERERGTLKEQLTELRMELEQAQYDLESLCEQRAEGEQADPVELQETQHRLRLVSADNQSLRDEQATMRQQIAELVDSARVTEEHEAEAAALRDHSAQLRQQLAVKDACIDELELRVSSADARAEELGSELQTLRDALETRHNEAGMAEDRLRRELAEAMTSLANAQNETAQALERASDAGVALQQARLADEDLQQRLAEAERCNEQAQQEQAESARQQGVMRSELDELRVALETADRAAREHDNASAAEVVQLRGTIESLQAKLAEAGRETAELRRVGEHAQSECDAANAICAELRGKVEELTAEKSADDTLLQQNLALAESQVSAARQQVEALRLQLAESQQTMADLDALRQRVEEQDIALKAAHQEQSELIESLNLANAEQQSLQAAVADRESAQARETDLENQLAVVLQSRQVQQQQSDRDLSALHKRLDDEVAQRQTLEGEADVLRALVESMEAESSAAAVASNETDALRETVTAKEGEIARLHKAVEDSAAQLKRMQAKNADNDAECQALRAELDLVREQAAKDVAQMRERITAAESRSKRQQSAGVDAIAYEAMRQRIEELESSLSERQRLLADAEESRQMLEDSLEDNNRQLEELKREIAQARTANSASLDRDAEVQRLQNALTQAEEALQHEDKAQGLSSLRDARLQDATPRASKATRWLSAVLGAATVLLVLEALSIASGRGELVSLLLAVAGSSQ